MLIEATGLSKNYGRVHALGPLSLELPTGSIALVGPNGAGKTTFLRLLMGLLLPTEGAATVLGRDVVMQGLSLRKQVGYMPEHECLIPEMTGVGFVSFMGRLSGLPPAIALSRAHDVLQFVGLREERYRKIAEYSLGMRQRVKLAQAIVHDPPLCLLDEPTAGLDPIGREEMLALLGTLAKKTGKSIILSTHLLEDVEGICDYLLVLDSGRAVTHGLLKELLSLGGTAITVRIKGDQDAFMVALASRGIRAQLVAQELRIERPSEGEKILFEVARETHTQIRHMGRSVQSVEELFLNVVNRPPPPSGGS
jgi:ABC-2 type transport system ATP-binding protein